MCQNGQYQELGWFETIKKKKILGAIHLPWCGTPQLSGVTLFFFCWTCHFDELNDSYLCNNYFVLFIILHRSLYFVFCIFHFSLLRHLKYFYSSYKYVFNSKCIICFFISQPIFLIKASFYRRIVTGFSVVLKYCGTSGPRVIYLSKNSQRLTLPYWVLSRSDTQILFEMTHVPVLKALSFKSWHFLLRRSQT